MVLPGGPGNDSLVGTDGDDDLSGFGGDDFLFGLGGRDFLHGGAGNDFIDGGEGLDWVFYDDAVGPIVLDLQAGTVTGGGGNDTLVGIEQASGSAFDDTLVGDGGDNVLRGGTGDDSLDGGAGWDTLDYFAAAGGVTVDLAAGGAGGADGNDTFVNFEAVTGSFFSDVLVGDAGSNAFAGAGGDDFIDGGAGFDAVDYWSATTGVLVDLGNHIAFDGLGGVDHIENIEHVAGSDFDDRLVGDAGNNGLDGGLGNDTLDGGLGDDSAVYQRATGSVTVDLEAGTASGALGNDVLSNIESVLASNFDDLLLGNGGMNNFDGLAGNDTVRAGAGQDFLRGGAGDDLLDGGADLDWAVYERSTGAVQVNLAAGTAGGADGNDTLVAIENVIGSVFDDVLLGDAGVNALQGGEGDDTMDAGAGSFDVVDYFGARGGVFVDLQAHSASGAAGNDTLFNFENIQGSFFDDVLSGDAADNSIAGLGGNDVLDGRGGRDNVAFYDATAGVTVDLVHGIAFGGSGTDVILNFENIQGSSFDDLLIGNALDNALQGDGGNDTLVGNGGDDFLLGSAGNDLIDGGADGPFGDNVSYFNALSGVNVNLATGAVSADGWGGSDTLAGVEHVEGSRFADVLVGSAGTNWFRPHEGDDAVDGAQGLDVVMYEDAAAGVTIDLKAGFARGVTIGNDTVLNVEAAHGSFFGDAITLSDSQGGYVFGRGGNDVLRGGSAGDNFIGGSGNDTLDGGAGSDNASYVEDGFDAPVTGLGVTVNLQTGVAIDNWGHVDTLIGIENVAGSQRDDRITGSDAFSRNEFFNGNDGNDTLQGGGGSDGFVGGRGNDVIQGGAITDLINFVDLNSVNYSSSEAGIVMDLATGVVQDGLGGVDTLSDINFVTGSRFADRITGSSGVYFEQFDGGLGDDVIDGGAIDPITFANSNRVTYFASASAVTVDLAAGTASGGLGNDTLIHINHVFGSRFGDVLTGSDSTITESFNGRGGNDSIDGAGGFDEVRYTNAAAAVDVNLATGVARDGEGGIDALSRIEGVRGSNFNDVLTGGNAAGDELEFFMGMAGNDTIDGGRGFDRADYTSSSSGVTATLGGTADGSALDGFGTTDLLRNVEGLRGSNFADTLTGSDTGAFESFEGRQGNDLIDGKGGTDRADYVSTVAGVTVDLAAGTAADGYGSTDTLVNIENVRGGGFDDRITGNALSNFLQGGAGRDTLAGGGGDDLLGGGAGDDALAGGAGFDQFLYQAGGNGIDTIGDFALGDTIVVSALVTGRSSAGNGGTVLAGQMQVSASNGSTTLYIGTDAAAGADVEIHFSGSFGATDFIALANANGATSIGLVETPARVAELAVQLRATSTARADVAGNVAGHSTSNEVAVGRLLDALDRAQAGEGGAGDLAGLAGDPQAADLDLAALVGALPAHPPVF